MPNDYERDEEQHTYKIHTKPIKLNYNVLSPR
jgi:hypothetical protein